MIEAPMFHTTTVIIIVNLNTLITNQEAIQQTMLGFFTPAIRSI